MTPLRSDAAYDAICDRGALTRRQLAIWAGDRLAAGSPVFVEAGMIHLHGELDAACFRRAFQAVVDESDALRIAFEDDAGWPRQRIHAGSDAVVDDVDLAVSAAPDAALEALAQERVGTRIGVGGALHDAALVRLARDHHVWLFAQHQLVSDAWSFGILHARLVEHYERLQRREPAITTASPSFSDYVEHERRFRGSARCEAARAFWQARYAVTAREPAVRWSIAGDAATRTCRLARPLGRALTLAVRRLTDTLDTSSDVGLFAVVASVVAAYVRCSTGSREVVFSTAFANRPSARFKRTAGSFMNVCPVRVAVDAADTFRALIDRVVAEVWEAGTHQQYVGRPGPVPQPYEIFLNVHKESVAARTFAELPIEVCSLAPTHRFGALGVAIEDFGATADVALVLDCNQAAFGPAARAALADELLGFLRACVADPDARVGDVRLRTPCGPARDTRTTRGAAEQGAACVDGIAVIWRELLGCERVGTDEDFFMLGGDSLLAYRMLTRVRTEVGVTVTVERFLERPTIAGLLAAGDVSAAACARAADETQSSGGQVDA